MNNNNDFWYNNPSILFNKAYIYDIVPLKSYTFNQKLNSLARFFIALSFVLVIIKNNINYLIFALFGLITTYLLHITFINEAFIANEQGLHTLPTSNNPFMNVLNHEIVDKPERPPAASHSDINIRTEVDKYFNENLFKDADDVWNKGNSQRQFYTTPNTTIPNDQAGAANWFYEGVNKVCKDGDLEMCGREDDIQLGRRQ
jgi:hypothetical protein